jgi:hypothetical protein
MIKGAGNPPLAQWQIDHIRKMQEELGSPDAEEVTMYEDTDEDMTGSLPQAASADDADVGGLAVYSDPNVQTSMSAFNKLAAEQQARYDAQAKALAEKRYGPSFSERMFQLSAALATPTAQRGLGGILGNITPVLAAQAQAKREGEIDRRTALEQLEAKRLAGQMGLAKQGVTTAMAMARLNAMAKKPRSSASPITVGPDMVPRSRLYGTTIKEPPQPAIYELQAYLADPTPSPQDKMTARRNFDTRFGYGAAEIFGGEQ